MKPSHRNLAREDAKREKLAAGKPKLSKYERKQARSPQTGVTHEPQA